MDSWFFLSLRRAVIFFLIPRVRLFCFVWVEARIFFLTNIRARIFFSKPPPPPPWKSNGRSLSTATLYNVKKVREVCHDFRKWWCQNSMYVIITKIMSWRQKVWNACHDIKTYIKSQNVCHQIKKYIMTSKSTSWRQTVCHNVQKSGKYVIKSKSAS